MDIDDEGEEQETDFKGDEIEPLEEYCHQCKEVSIS
jgi:hypothetical protein